MTRTTRTPLALVLAGVLVLAATLATLAAAPAQAAGKPGPVPRFTVGDARIAGTKAAVPLSWGKAPRARTYQVRWARTASMRKAHTATVRKRSITVRGLAVGRTWCFQVRGVAGAKKGRRTAPVCRRIAQPGQSRSPWVTRQRVVSSGVELTLTWAATAGARTYELDYAIPRDPVAGEPPSKNPSRRTVRTASTGAVVGGLRPSTVYCFQVRAITPHGPTLRSGMHCKMTMPTDRSAPAADALPLDVATWNICAGTAAGCTSHDIGKRLPLIGRRIASMGVDVATLQEAPFGRDAAVARAAGFGVGCNSREDGRGAEAVLVRSARYSVVGSGRRLSGPGACWVELEHKGTSHRVIVVSLHLAPGTGAAVDAERRTQIQNVLNWLPDRPGVPVVIGGDYNSSRSRDNDSPRPPLERAGFLDSYDIAAAYLSPTALNSANNWQEIPRQSPRWGAHIDRVFTSRGTYVASWQVVEPREGGRFTQLLSDHSPVRVGLQVPAS